MLDSGSCHSNGFRHPPTLGGAIRQWGKVFRQANIETAFLDARLLAAEACGLSIEELIVNGDHPLSRSAAHLLDAFAARRLNGEPVSRIIGRREFWGLPFRISEQTLDPRPETELLVEAALDYTKENDLGERRLCILDLGTGSGCILAALLRELPLSFGMGVDISFEALNTARKNLLELGLLDRVVLLCANWLSALRERTFDIIVCNPPYIPSKELDGLAMEVKDHDPRGALDGGLDGLDAYRHIIPACINGLSDNGVLIFETGSEQACTVSGMMTEAGKGALFETRIFKDLSGRARAVAGVRQSLCYTTTPKKKIGNPLLSR